MTNPTGLVAVRLDSPLLERLNALAKSTGRTKSFYIKRALSHFIEEMEDTFIAVERLEKPGKRCSMKEAKEILNVED